MEIQSIVSFKTYQDTKMVTDGIMTRASQMPWSCGHIKASRFNPVDGSPQRFQKPESQASSKGKRSMLEMQLHDD